MSSILSEVARLMITTVSNDIKERLSIAYVTAVTARAGCQVSKLEIDKQSIDATIRPISGPKVCIDLQLKATSQECYQGDQVSYDLPVKNYDDLRETQCTAPHYLVVLVLDPSNTLWLASDETKLLIARCAYWADLRGEPATTNQATINVKLPRSQRFDVEAVKMLIKSAYETVASKPILGG